VRSVFVIVVISACVEEILHSGERTHESDCLGTRLFQLLIPSVSSSVLMPSNDCNCNLCIQCFSPRQLDACASVIDQLLPLFHLPLLASIPLMMTCILRSLRPLCRHSVAYTDHFLIVLLSVQSSLSLFPLLPPFAYSLQRIHSAVCHSVINSAYGPVYCLLIFLRIVSVIGALFYCSRTSPLDCNLINTLMIRS